jgi:nucleoid DNA-binding protein
MSDNLVTQGQFYQRLNERVFGPHIDKYLTFDQARDIVHGLADVICEIVLDDRSVRLGKLGTFKSHTTPAGPRWNPAKKKRFKGPETKKIVFHASKSTKRLLSY